MLMDEHKKSYFVKILSYAFIGIIGTAIHFTTLISLVELFQIDPVISSSIGFMLTVIISFILNKRITFRVNRGKTSLLFVKYLIVSIIGFILNSSIMFISVHILLIHYSLAQMIVVIIIPITNFLLNNYWTFKNTSTTDPL